MDRPITRLLALQIAAAAACDPRTVAAWLRHRKDQKQIVVERIALAAQKLGVERPAPPTRPAP